MKISSYAVLSNPQLGDKLIGTDVNNMDVTKNFTIESILALGSNTPSYKVLSIGNISYSGTQLYSNLTLESTLGNYSMDLINPNQLIVTLADYVSTGIDINKLYVTSQQTFDSASGVFQPNIESSNLMTGEIVFYCSALNGTVSSLDLGNLEIRIYN